VCIVGEECHRVLESKYNKILGIPNEVLGLALYIAISFITAFLVIGIGPATWWDRLAEIMILGGTVMSLYFVYLQWKVIRAWCIWCLISTTTIFFMALIILTGDLTLI